MQPLVSCTSITFCWLSGPRVCGRSWGICQPLEIHQEIGDRATEEAQYVVGIMYIYLSAASDGTVHVRMVHMSIDAHLIHDEGRLHGWGCPFGRAP